MFDVLDSLGSGISIWIIATLTTSAGAGEEVDGGDGPEDGDEEEQEEDGDDQGRVQVQGRLLVRVVKLGRLLDLVPVDSINELHARVCKNINEKKINAKKIILFSHLSMRGPCRCECSDESDLITFFCRTHFLCRETGSPGPGAGSTQGSTLGRGRTFYRQTGARDPGEPRTYSGS